MLCSGHAKVTSTRTCPSTKEVRAHLSNSRHSGMREVLHGSLLILFGVGKGDVRKRLEDIGSSLRIDGKERGREGRISSSSREGGRVGKGRGLEKQQNARYRDQPRSIPGREAWRHIYRRAWMLTRCERAGGELGSMNEVMSSLVPSFLPLHSTHQGPTANTLKPLSSTSSMIS